MPEESDPQKLFEACVESCADSMYRVAWRMTGDSATAEDLVQESYSQAWQKIDSLRDITKMRSWLFAILRNQCLKSIHKRNPSPSSAVDSITDHRNHWQENTYSDDSVDIVQRAMEQLEDDQRLPILLVSMEGISVDEASEILAIPRGTVLSRMHRGRKRLKEIIEKGNAV